MSTDRKLRTYLKMKIKLITKIKCKFGYHEEESFSVQIRPVIHSSIKELTKVMLPTYESVMWVCKHCKKERIIWK